MSGGHSGVFQWGSSNQGGSHGGASIAAGRARSGSAPDITNADAARLVEEATAAELKERGIKVPTYSDKPMSQASIFWCGLFAGLMSGLFIGLVFWELT